MDHIYMLLNKVVVLGDSFARDTVFHAKTRNELQQIVSSYKVALDGGNLSATDLDDMAQDIYGWAHTHANKHPVLKNRQQVFFQLLDELGECICKKNGLFSYTVDGKECGKIDIERF